MSTHNPALPIQYDVFISHRSDNKPWVEILARNLQNQGYKVFLDLWELVPAGSLTQGLFQGLQQSRAGILVVTPEVWESGWVREEYQQMMVQKVRDGFVIIPVVLGQDIPAVPFLQDILWINFRSPSPEAYREAFYRLLCALEQRAPGPEVPVLDDLLMPPAPAVASPPSADELAFIEDLFERLYTQQAILLCAQADRGPSAFSAPFLQRAYGQFGRSQVVHLTLPCTPQPQVQEFYQVVGQQCGLPQPVLSHEALLYALEERLATGNTLCMLVSGLENTWEAGRRELAGMFRSLNERHAGRFRLFLSGGEKLAELYYAGTLSLLNQAELREWPELTMAEAQRVVAQRLPGQALSVDTVALLFDLCGAHPRLFELCLQEAQRVAGWDVHHLRQRLLVAPFVWQLFTPFRQQPVVRQRLCGLLAQREVGEAVPYLADVVVRQLYWKNLLKRQGQRLVWRCELLRLAGQRVLECGGTP